MLRRICTKCGRIYDGGVLECDRCHLFLRDYEDSALDAGFYAGQPSAMPEQQPIDKTIGMQPGARAYFQAQDAPRPQEGVTDAWEPQRGEAFGAAAEEPRAQAAQAHRRSAMRRNHQQPPAQEEAQAAQNDFFPGQDAPGAGSGGGGSEPPVQEPPEQRRGPDAPESGFHAQAPLDAASVRFFKVFYKLIGWLAIVVGVLLGVLLLGGSASSQARMYLGRDAASVLISLGWLIPLAVILFGMMQIAEGNLLGVLLDTNRKLSSEYPANTRAYTSATLSLMKGLYVLAGWLEIIAGVILGLQAGGVGFVLSALIGGLSGLFMIMQSKRIALLLDNNSKAAAMAAYLAGRNG